MTIDSLYVASSWKNEHQPIVVDLARSNAIRTYDFKDSDGFHWKEVDLDSSNHTYNEYIHALTKDRALQGFGRDFQAMQESSACVLVLPCGRSAHLEAGWFIGKNRPTCIFIPEYDMTPDLMYLMAAEIHATYEGLEQWLRSL